MSDRLLGVNNSANEGSRVNEHELRSRSIRRAPRPPRAGAALLGVRGQDLPRADVVLAGPGDARETEQAGHRADAEPRWPGSRPEAHTRGGA